MRKEEQEHMTKAQCKMRLYEHQKAQREDLDREEEGIIGTILCALTIIGASTFVGAGIIGIYTYVLGV
jgi:hypothetical protein